jgi:hypothetical protein
MLTIMGPAEIFKILLFFHTIKIEDKSSLNKSFKLKYELIFFSAYFKTPKILRIIITHHVILRKY